MSDASNPAPSGLQQRPPGYAEWLTDLKTRIHAAQQRAVLAVNRELLLLYWELGRDILARQVQAGWGAGIVDQVSRDLRATFPDLKGFSRTNLLYMRAFAEAWSEPEIVQQAVGQLPDPATLPQMRACTGDSSARTPSCRERPLADRAKPGPRFPPPSRPAPAARGCRARAPSRTARARG